MASKGRLLRRFDLGNKAVEGICDTSVLGAVVTVASVILMTVLFLSELVLLIKVDTVPRMTLADFHEHDVVSVRLHVTFPHIECKDLEIIADNPQGSTGAMDGKSVDRRPASESDLRPFEGHGGNELSSGLGCTLDGTIEVARAGGFVHIHVMHHDPSRLMIRSGVIARSIGEMRTGPSAVAGPNVTHKIHDFAFGVEQGVSVSGGGNPLAGSMFVSEEGAGQVRYSLKVVPISHRRIYGQEAKRHTYSSNMAFVSEDEAMQVVTSSQPWLGVEFKYDFTPVMIRYTDKRKSLFEFLTSVCAIVGGIYTVSGLVVQSVGGLSRKKQD